MSFAKSTKYAENLNLYSSTIKLGTLLKLKRKYNDANIRSSLVKLMIYGNVNEKSTIFYILSDRSLSSIFFSLIIFSKS